MNGDGSPSPCVECVATEQWQGEHVDVIASSQPRVYWLGGCAQAGAAVVVVLLFAIGATACGDRAARRSTGLASSHSSARVARPTQPSVATVNDNADGSAITAAAVHKQLDALMRRYDAATSALLAHPSDAPDQTAAATKEYLSVLAPGSSFASGALASWAREGVQGHSYRPGSRGQLLATQVTSVEPVMSDTVGFGVCVASSFVLVDGAGQVLESQGGLAVGHGVAVLIGGQWLLRDLSLTTSSACSAPLGSS